MPSEVFEIITNFILFVKRIFFYDWKMTHSSYFVISIIDEHYSTMQSYVERIHKLPAYEAALKKGGKYDYA